MKLYKRESKWSCTNENHDSQTIVVNSLTKIKVDKTYSIVI